MSILHEATPTGWLIIHVRDDDEPRPHAYEPTDADDLFRHACAGRGVWEFARSARLATLLRRARRLQDDLRRERCDSAPEDLAGFDARLRALDARVRRLSSAARKARRDEQRAEQLARQVAASEAIDRMLAHHERDRTDDMTHIGAAG